MASPKALVAGKTIDDVMYLLNWCRNESCIICKSEASNNACFNKSFIFKSLLIKVTLATSAFG